MNLAILRINKTKKPPCRTKVNVRQPWLADMGFVCDAPVWATPQQNGFTLTLQDERNTPEHGKLIHVGLENTKPSLILNFANNFYVDGLSGGDFLAAKYDYGVIQAQKLPQAQAYYLVSSREYEAFLQMCGGWLNDAGFVPDTVTTVSVADNCITLSAWQDATASYGDIVKFARKRKYQIIQPKRNQHITVVDIPEYILCRVGLGKGDICGVRYELGIITLFKPDLQQLELAVPEAL